MNITKVPEIIGPNFGGIIYGLSLKHGYSTSPSELTLNIVSRNGQYNIGQQDLNKLQTIRFGGFTFTGYIWEYKINTTSEEALLEVKLFDGSVILDRYWVALWKRGLLGRSGSSESQRVTFNFNDESILVPSVQNFGKIRFIEKRLGTESISIPYRSNASVSGNILLIGREQIPNSDCEIPTTDYNFQEFASICPVPTNGLNIDPEYRGTYEGRLRDVLNSWCEASGFSFYWDFANNTIQYYDSARGFSASLPNVNDKSIISKEESYSMKGTFKQFAISWAGKPREPLKTLSQSARVQTAFQVNPFPLDFFAGKEARKQSITGKSGRFGKGRGKFEFIQSAVVGTVSKDLRDAYNLYKNNLHVLGIEGEPLKDEPKRKLINFLIGRSYEGISELKKLSSNLANFHFIIGSFNQAYADTWHQIEQSIITKIGSSYRIGLQSSTLYFCKNDSFTTVNITVDPEATVDEELGSDFEGARIFNRGGGGIVPGGNVALDELKFEEKDIQSKLDLLQPRLLGLQESGLLEDIKNLGIIDEKSKIDPTTLIIVPNSDFVRKFLKLDVNTTTRSHPTESTIKDVAAAKKENSLRECKDFERAKESGSCQSYEDIARSRALQNASSEKERKELYSGLINDSCSSVKISLGGGSRTTIYLPSESPYQVVLTVESQHERISQLDDSSELLYSNGNTGSADDVEQIEIILNNVTDSKFEKFRSSARKARLPKGKDINANKPLSRIAYTFVGEPTITNLTPSNGIESLDVSLSSDGFKTSVSFASRAPKRGNIDGLMDRVNSQFRRNAYNSG